MTAVHNPDWRLRRGFAAPEVAPIGHLGVDLSSWHKPKLKLSDYYDRGLAQPPSAVARPHQGIAWGTLANDRLGDCVCAMLLHSIKDFHLDASTLVPEFTDADAILLYEKIGNYDPNNPSSDQGCDESVAMQTWEAGLPQTSDGVVHQIAGTVSVNPQDLLECRLAIYEFVALQMGVSMPVSAQGQTEWDVVGNPQQDPNSQPGSWGGHAVPYREYDPDTFKCVTWGSELLVTVGFHNVYASEAHVVITKEMLNNSGVGPSGVQWDDLLSDLGKLVAAPQKAEDPKPPAAKRPAKAPAKASKGSDDAGPASDSSEALESSETHEKPGESADPDSHKEDDSK